MYIIELTFENSKYIHEAAELLKQAFPHSYMNSAEEEVLKCLEEKKF